MYDITDRDSFNSVHGWMSEIEKHANENISKMIVGNKKDIENERKISFEEGKEVAEHYGCKFLEISAKTDEYIVEWVFTILTLLELEREMSDILPEAPKWPQ